jgi:dTDP-glucose 4,6-dehydratase
MRVLVTGGCGFIGSAVVRLAVERGDQVLNLDRRRKSTPVPALAGVAGKPGYARLEADITDRSMLRALVHEYKPDAIIHLAANPEGETSSLFDSEIAGAFSVLEAARAYHAQLQGAARGKFRLVHAMAAETDTINTSPPTPLQAARATAAALADNWSRAHGLPLVGCVAAEVFGPWQPDNAFLSELVCSLVNGRVFTVQNGGATVRDWLPVRDFAAGILAAAEKAEPHSRIDFSAGAERRELDVAEAVCILLDNRAPLRGGASWAGYIQVAGDISTALTGPMLDEKEAERELGWHSQGFHAGLDRVLSWAISRYAPQQARAVAAE